MYINYIYLLKYKLSSVICHCYLLKEVRCYSLLPRNVISFSGNMFLSLSVILSQKQGEHAKNHHQKLF